MPALGTGGLKYPPRKVASATINAVNLHNEQFKESSIQTVNVVLLDDDKELIQVMDGWKWGRNGRQSFCRVKSNCFLHYYFGASPGLFSVDSEIIVQNLEEF